jgi:hypothetical protein
MSLTKLSPGGNNFYMTSLFLPKESLVSDIPAGGGNMEKLFLPCTFLPFILKIVGNEKYDGSRDSDKCLSGVNLGPWRSIFIFILNIPSAIKIRISVAAYNSKILGDYFDNRQ